VPVAPAHYDIHQDASLALAQWGPGIAYSRVFRFRTGPDVETPNGEIECDLCEAWTMASPTVYEVTLRAGVKWQDLAPVSGRPLTAADVVFSLRRQSTPGWPNSPVLDPVGGIVAVGERTVRFTLTRPDAEFLERLADGHSRIVAPEVVAIRGDLLAGPTIGTGPWQLLEASDSAFKYVGNPGYFEPGVPTVDFLQVVVLPSDGVRASALRTHTLDFVSVGAAELADAVHTFPDLLWSKAIQPGAGVEVALNANVPPFDSLEARRAALLAIDPWRDVNEVWLGGVAVTAGLPVPSASWLLPRETLADFLAQPRRAAELAAASGLAQGTPLEITVAEFSPEYADQASRIAQDLAAVGFRPALQRVSTRRFADNVWFGGKFQMFVGAQPPVSSLSDYLLAVHHSKGTWNTTGYRSTELDALIEAQVVATDPARRRQLALDIQAEIMRGAYRFSPATLYTHWAWWPGVEGFGPNTYRGESFFLAKMWLSRQ
jgi:ABC-type transport system substrate-binding protein